MEKITNPVAPREESLDSLLRRMARKYPSYSFGVFWNQGRWVVVANPHDGQEEIQVIAELTPAETIQSVLKLSLEFAQQRASSHPHILSK